MSEALREAARAIFADAMQAVDVQTAVRHSIDLREGRLHIATHSVALDCIKEVVVVAIGKAAIPMYEAAAGVLTAVPCRSVVVAPVETYARGVRKASRRHTTLLLPGDHPTPTVRSLQAADAILSLLQTATTRTVVLFLISGGASAMVEKPLDAGIGLNHLAAFSRALVGSGLNIVEMNTLRKHLSAVKGGRLAQAASVAAMQSTILISDVPAGSPDVIASGPSLPDSTTVADARRLISRLATVHRIPVSIQRWFKSAALPETPKTNNPAFRRASYQVILSSEHLAAAAHQAAHARGFYTTLDNTCDDWDYRDAGRYLLDRSMHFAAEHGKTCLLSVGEVGVRVAPAAGEGGRNQHFALWCAAELARRVQHATVLSAGSDGVDGHSSAAGAVCDETTVHRASQAGLDVDAALAEFNVAPLLGAIGDQITTGPSGNNLRDLRLVLTE